MRTEGAKSRLWAKVAKYEAVRAARNFFKTLELTLTHKDQ